MNSFFRVGAVISALCMFVVALTNINSPEFSGFFTAGWVVLLYLEVEKAVGIYTRTAQAANARESLRAIGMSDEMLAAGIRLSLEGKHVTAEKGLDGKFRLMVDGRPVTPDKPDNGAA